MKFELLIFFFIKLNKAFEIPNFTSIFNLFSSSNSNERNIDQHSNSKFENQAETNNLKVDNLFHLMNDIWDDKNEKPLNFGNNKLSLNEKRFENFSKSKNKSDKNVKVENISKVQTNKILERKTKNEESNSNNCNQNNQFKHKNIIANATKSANLNQTKGLDRTEISVLNSSKYKKTIDGKVKKVDGLNKPQILNKTKDSESSTYFEYDHWTRIRTVASNLQSIFRTTYGDDSRDKAEILGLLDKMIEIGDKINVMQKIKDSFDPDLINFLEEKWKGIEEKMLKNNPVYDLMLSVNGRLVLLTMARGLAKQFGNYFHKDAFKHTNEQEFLINNMKMAGFLDDEIFEVFDLLNIPSEYLVNTSKTLLNSDIIQKDQKLNEENGHFEKDNHQFDSKNSSITGRSDAYGKMKKDPLLLLAGLSFATYAAYIIYRLISTTPAAGKRKRSTPDVSLSLSLSDMPDVLTNLYDWVKSADDTYNVNEIGTGGEETLVNSINHVWKLSRNKNMKCVKKFLCEHVQANTFRILSYNVNFQFLILNSLSELLGVGGLGKNSDEMISSILNGKMLNCNENSFKCPG